MDPLDEEVTDEELQILRIARGLGLTTVKPWPLLEALWNRGLVVRDNVQPYTYRTEDSIARALDASEAAEEEE